MPKTTAKSPSPRNEKHDSLKNAMADLKKSKKASQRIYKKRGFEAKNNQKSLWKNHKGSKKKIL